MIFTLAKEFRLMILLKYIAAEKKIVEGAKNNKNNKIIRERQDI